MYTEAEEKGADGRWPRGGEEARRGREVVEEGENGGLSRILTSVGFHLK